MLSPELSAIWFATVEQAIGGYAKAEGLLQEIEASVRPLERMFLQRRRSVPIQIVVGRTSERSNEIIQALEQLVDEESRLKDRAEGAPIVTFGLMAVIVGMFLLQLSYGPTDAYLPLQGLGALQPASVLAGAWWRTVAAQFLHVGISHLLFNVLALYFLCPFVERALGRALCLGAYLGCGIVSNTGIVLLAWLGFINPLGQLVGASGSIMGLVGITAGLMLRAWYAERAGLAWSRFRGAVSIVVLQMVLDFFTPQVSLSAHLFGAIAGFVLGMVLPHRLGVAGPA